MRKLVKILAFVLLILLPAASCSTTSKLKEGEYKLKKNTIVIDGDAKGLTTADVSSYARTADLYSPRLVDASCSNINKHLTYLGYYNSTVTGETEFKKKKAKITYHIVPGERYVIDAMKFNLDGDDIFRKDFLAHLPRITVAKGDYLSESALTNECDITAEFMRNRGYYGFSQNNFSFVADTLTDPGKLILQYNVKCDLPKAHIGDVSVSYPESLPFKEKVLRNMINLTPGMLYSDRSVNVAYNRLSNLSVFNSVGITMTPRDSSDVVDCAIKLGTSQIQGFRANVDASINASGLLSLSPQISYFHNNFFHGSEQFNLSFAANLQYRPSDKSTAQEYSVTAGILLPQFLGLKFKLFRGSNIPKTEFKVSFSYQDRPEYKRTVLAFSYGYNGIYNRRKDYLTYQFYPIKINSVRLPQMSESFFWTLMENPMLWNSYMDHINLGLNGNIYWSNSPEALPKTTYRYLRASVETSGNLVSVLNKVLPKNEYDERLIFGLPYSQFARIDLSAGYTWRFGKENQFALASRVNFGIGKAYGNSKTLPFEQQFFCGGANSMRAWQARCLGPGAEEFSDVFVFPCQIGDMKFEADAELRFPLIWKLEGAAFLEAGNIWMLPTEDPIDESTFSWNTFASQIAVDWGLGLRVNLDFLLVRLDMGMKVHDPANLDIDNGWRGPNKWLNKNGFAIQFGIGYPF